MSKRVLARMWPYWLICGLVFYVPWSLAMWFRGGNTGLWMVLLLAVMPMTCLVVSVAFAARHKAHILFSIGNAVLFVPVVLLFMDGLENSTGWVYVPVYFVVSLLGCLLGNIRHWMKG